ncbi:hypothetical protein JP0129_09790 [Helicobacter pylori]|nr:hypothetical protein JP0129_09790 [Helicobacter pylori]
MATSKSVGNLSLAVKRVGISSPAVEEQKCEGEVMEENRDGHAIVSNVIKSLEKGGSFSPSD